MKNTIIIYRKQLKDTKNNVALWIQFVMFPVMAAIMDNSIRVEGMPEHFFVGMQCVFLVFMFIHGCFLHGHSMRRHTQSYARRIYILLQKRENIFVFEIGGARRGVHHDIRKRVLFFL